MAQWGVQNKENEGRACLGGRAGRHAIMGRAAVADPAIGPHVILRSTQLADRDEQALLLIKLADLVLQHREEPGLDTVSQLAYWCARSLFLHEFPFPFQASSLFVWMAGIS